MTTQQSAVLTANHHLQQAVTCHDAGSSAGVSWHLWLAALAQEEPRTLDPELEAALNSL